MRDANMETTKKDSVSRNNKTVKIINYVSWNPFLFLKSYTVYMQVVAF